MLLKAAPLITEAADQCRLGEGHDPTTIQFLTINTKLSRAVQGVWGQESIKHLCRRPVLFLTSSPH